MHFSARSEYGVRLMVALARRGGEGPLSLTEIAHRERMPLAFLEQVIAPLRRAGLVSSTQGARGGYRLARPAESISMGQVVRTLEGPLALVACTAESGAAMPAVDCGCVEDCEARHLWTQVQESITRTLDSLTLADIANGRRGKGERASARVEKWGRAHG